MNASAGGRGGWPPPPPGFVRFERSELEQSIPRRFEQMAVRYPDRLAVKSPAWAVTYAELDAEANRIAHAVLERAEPGAAPVALLLEHGPALIPAMLGVLKAGKFYVPIDPVMPPARAAELLADLDAQLLLTNGDTLAAARALAGDRLRIVDLDAIPAHLGADRPGVPVAPDDLAYIIYTSGSTGRPKGVVVDHRYALHYTMNYTNSSHYNRDDRVTWLSALGTHAAAVDIYPALLNGGAVFPFAVKDEGVERLAAWLRDERISCYGSVPVVFRSLAASLVGADLLPDLRLLRLGGDQLLRSDVELFKAHFSRGCVLRNGYGASEAVTIRLNLLDRDAVVTTHEVPVGYPVEDAELLILGEDGEPLAVGEVGEIALRSRYMARGYWRQPELTATRFREIADGSGERIYLTGDLGRLLADGCLVHLGRKDFQANIRGRLIAPIEVENALLDIPAIKEAVVVARPDARGEACLVAYFVPGDPPGPTVSSIRRKLAETLPAELIPAAFVALDAIPLTPNKKVDRPGLPPPALTRPAVDTAFVAPRGPIETALVEIWDDVLKIGEIGVCDHFLELGGNSLLATQVVNRALERFALDLPPTTLLEASTVEAMALIVVEALMRPRDSPPFTR